MLLSYLSVLVLDTGTILSSARTHDLNESHIHPSTCSSTLRTSFKSGRFLNIFFLLSSVSKKLFNSWHILCISIQNKMVWLRLILTKCFFYQLFLLNLNSKEIIDNKELRSLIKLNIFFFWYYVIDNTIILSFFCGHKGISFQIVLYNM